MSFYVNMNDGFMSGWGKASRGRSILVIECDTLAQAEAIEQAALRRSEMRRVAIADKPRRGRAGDHISRKRFADMGGPWLAYYRSENETEAPQ